ncbi:helix-turn-helix transcriptional regulator [Bradyrhizobium elkanii]|uniref:helix-turn-helix transcriptional regulator n=1 Tax=Bradyrhizobium elkanii TaxID=29448 RepID=UPI003D206239
MTKDRKLVTKRELKDVYGVPYCHAHLLRLEAQKLFPVRVRLSVNRVAWWSDEIEAWLSSRPRS